MRISAVHDWQHERLTDGELRELFGRLFPHGFAGADVLAEVAPDGWEQSPLLACLHPSVERLFEERLRSHRNIEALHSARRSREGASETAPAALPEPTLEGTRREYHPNPVKPEEELTELLGQCLWDVFSDNHEVIAADGRVADIGSFRGASAFLDEYVSGGDADPWGEGDCMRFYMGTLWTAGRADLTPVYALIFRRLESVGADWVYHFPEIHLVDFSRLRDHIELLPSDSPSEAAAAERKAGEHRAEVERLRAELTDVNARARQEAMDRVPPATVRAYRSVYGRDPRGWPPA